MSKHTLILLAILLFALVTRLYNLSNPAKYYFDEVYHAVTAKLYARNDPAGYEWWHSAPEPDTAIEWLHPPIAKLTQAVGIKIFGENSFGWRISSVLFGVFAIYLVYALSLELGVKKHISLLATFLASLDGLLLTQSRIAMNDIHVTCFILLSLLLYTKWKKHPNNKLLLFTGISAGLAVSTKWSGIFVIGIFGLHQLIEWIVQKKFPAIQNIAKLFLVWLVVPAVIYILSFSQFWLQGHTVAQFKELHNQIWYYQTHLKATHPYQSRPLQWAFDLRPVWMYVSYGEHNTVSNIYNLGNPILFWAGLCAVLWSSIQTIKHWKTKHAPYLFLVISYAVVWMLWIFSPRIMFFYHYTPAVPLLCIMLALWIEQLMKKEYGSILAWNILVLSIIWFILFYPNLTAISVPRSFADAVYFMIPSWK